MENRNISENKTDQNNKPIETDSAEIVRQHLEDENHEITDADMRNVKIVGTDDGEPVITGAEAKAKFERDKENKDANDENTPGPERPITPWDVVSD